MDEITYLKVTHGLMTELGIRVRDTFSFRANFDDHNSNGKYDGPRLLKIEWTTDVDRATVSAKKYEISGQASLAYDGYKIRVPPRFQAAGRDDPVIHECVHFLQHNTKAEDDAYFLPVDSSPLAYARYLAQRVELEAHLVQVAYIAKSCESYMAGRLAPDDVAEVRRLLAACGTGVPRGPTLELLTYCKNKGLI